MGRSRAGWRINMALLDDVKLALRISHNKLDSEIADLISAAREDMKRAGMTATAVMASYPAVMKMGRISA